MLPCPPLPGGRIRRFARRTSSSPSGADNCLSVSFVCARRERSTYPHERPGLTLRRHRVCNDDPLLPEKNRLHVADTLLHHHRRTHGHTRQLLPGLLVHVALLLQHALKPAVVLLEAPHAVRQVRLLHGVRLDVALPALLAQRQRLPQRTCFALEHTHLLAQVRELELQVVSLRHDGLCLLLRHLQVAARTRQQRLEVARLLGLLPPRLLQRAAFLLPALRRRAQLRLQLLRTRTRVAQLRLLAARALTRLAFGGVACALLGGELVVADVEGRLEALRLALEALLVGCRALEVCGELRGLRLAVVDHAVRHLQGGLVRLHACFLVAGRHRVLLLGAA
eukprot:Rhum_TRINITY_DN13222_c0_g1::Rhum_TRINITY_DN13222_c0_g1_i2::g.58182::m.58182